MADLDMLPETNVINVPTFEEDTSDNTMTIIIFLSVLFGALAIIAAVAIGVAVFIIKRRRKRRRYLRVNYASQSELSHRSDVTALSRCSDIIAHNLCSDLVALNRNSDVSTALDRSQAADVGGLDVNNGRADGGAGNGTAASLKKSSTLDKLYASLECVNTATATTELSASRTPIQFQLGSDGEEHITDSHKGYLNAAEELAKCSYDSGLSCTPGFSPQMKHRRTCSRSMPSLNAHAEALNFILATPPSYRVGAVSVQAARPKSFTEKFNLLVSGKNHHNVSGGGSNRGSGGLGGIRIRPRSFNDKLNLAVNRSDVEVLSFNNFRQRTSSGKSTNDGSVIINPTPGGRDVQVHSSHAASRLARNRRQANSVNCNNELDLKKQQNGGPSPFANFRQGVSTKISSIRASFSKDGRRQMARANAESVNPGILASNGQTVQVIISNDDGKCEILEDSKANEISLRPNANGSVNDVREPSQNNEGVARLACPTEYVRSFSDFELPGDLSTMDSLKSELNGVFTAAMEREATSTHDSDECRINIRSDLCKSEDFYPAGARIEMKGSRINCDAPSREEGIRGKRTSSQSCSQLIGGDISRFDSNDQKHEAVALELSQKKKSCSSGRILTTV